MKLKLTKNLDSLRDEAISAIDAAHSVKLAEMLRFQAIHALKLKEAEAVLSGSLESEVRYLEAEAKLRGMTVKDLATLVKDSSARSNSEMLEMEVSRQSAKASIRAASTPAQITEIKNRFAL